MLIAYASKHDTKNSDEISYVICEIPSVLPHACLRHRLNASVLRKMTALSPDCFWRDFLAPQEFGYLPDDAVHNGERRGGSNFKRRQ